MITRKNEAIVPGVKVGHIIEIQREEVGLSLTIGERVLHKEGTLWGIVSDDDCTDDYHSGLVRQVPKYQSNYLGGEVTLQEDMVWNERAISVAIAQELAVVADILDIQKMVEVTKPFDLMKATGLRMEFIEANNVEAIAQIVVAIALGSNIMLDDPQGLMRSLMGNGNVIGFLGDDNHAGGALIVSSYNQPCTKPGKRVMEMFPTTVLSNLMKGSFAREVMELLGPYRGWVGGVFAPGHVSIGDKAFVNVAPTTPPLPNEL